MLNRRNLIQVSIGALAAHPLRAAGKTYLVYWGTYTAGGPQYGTGASKGIYVSRFESETGKLTSPELAAETANPSYLAIHPNRRYLYSVNEHIDHSGKIKGEVSAFSVDRKTGRLVELNRVSSKGGMPCHIVTDKSGKSVFAANWSTGSTVSFPVRTDGRLGESSGFFQHSGERSGVEPSGRSPQVHCHAVAVSPDNRFLIGTDTGLNKIFVHRLNAATAEFAPHDPPFLGLKGQVNPRHIVFHPNRKWAYVANEAGPGCTMLRYDERRGTFEEGAVTRTVPADYQGRGTPAEAVIHPSGRFVYVSNRGHDSMAVLKIDQTDGSLSLIEAFPLGGNGPRSFNVDPAGRFLIALLQRSNMIVPLRIDADSGRLSAAGERLSLASPVCAKFIEI